MINNWQTVPALATAIVSLQACTTLTEQEREQIAYDLNEARSIYEDRRQACLNANGSMVTESLTGSRRLSISEMQWAYCHQ
jgi:hypothetical protein